MRQLKPNKIPLIVRDLNGKRWIYYPSGLLTDPPSWFPLPAEAVGNTILSSRWNSMETAIQSVSDGHTHDNTNSQLLSNALPTTIAYADAATAGTSGVYAFAAHRHGFPAGSTTPVTQAFADIATVGTSADIARADHKHGFPAANTTPITQAIADTAAVGTSADIARGDHKHGMPTFASPSAITAGGAGSDGILVTLVRSDHVHAASTGTPTVTQVIALSAGAGTATTFSRSDHSHAMSAGTTTPVTQAIGDIAAVGTSTDFARGDHTHGMPTFGTPSAVTAGGSNTAGTSTSLPRLDHVHGASVAAPVTTEGVGQAAAAGTATTFSRSDHVHPLAGSATPTTQAFSDVAAAGSNTTFARSDHLHGMPADGGFPLLGETILGADGNTLTSPTVAAKNYLIVFIKGKKDGTTGALNWREGAGSADSAANYAWRESINNGTANIGSNDTSGRLINTLAANAEFDLVVQGSNDVNFQKKRSVTGTIGLTGAGTDPDSKEGGIKYTGTAQSTVFQVLTATTNMLANSRIAVFGTN